MTPEQQRIAIAEACGWTNVSLRLTEYSERGYNAVLGTDPVNGMNDRIVPDYLNDLNAMHEAEKVLTGYQLTEYVERFVEWNSTATQRAEYFLRTLGL